VGDNGWPSPQYSTSQGVPGGVRRAGVVPCFWWKTQNGGKMSYPPQQVPDGAGPAGEQYPPQQGVGWAPHSGVPAPQPPKRKRTGLVIGIVAGALAVLLGVAVTLVVVLQPKEVQVGDCIDVFDEQASRVERVKCGSAESDYDV